MARLVDQAATVTTLAHRRMDTDQQSRQVLDRMAVDFAQMVKRSDVDFHLKSPANPEPGNDQIAFYAMVPGYFPATGSQSPVSLVAYRISSQNKLERMGKGLVWNAVSPANAPMVFLPLTIAATWPAATNRDADSDYEWLGAHVFRFEYAYLLNDGTVSPTPWSPGHSAAGGMGDVAAIDVFLAITDSRARGLLTASQMASLARAMPDFAGSMGPGDLLDQWQSAINEAAIPRPAAQGCRLYERQFRLVR
jgi:hypothetical protein